MIYFKKISIPAIIVFLSIILIGCSSSTGTTKIIDMVKNGNFDDYPNVSIGDSFDNFIGDEKWTQFISDEGKTIVEVTGNCTYMDESVQMRAQFEIFEDDTFEMFHFGLNDIPQNNLMISGFIDAVMEDYNN